MRCPHCPDRPLELQGPTGVISGFILLQFSDITSRSYFLFFLFVLITSFGVERHYQACQERGWSSLGFKLSDLLIFEQASQRRWSFHYYACINTTPLHDEKDDDGFERFLATTNCDDWKSANKKIIDFSERRTISSCTINLCLEHQKIVFFS